MKIADISESYYDVVNKRIKKAGGDLDKSREFYKKNLKDVEKRMKSNKIDPDEYAAWQKKVGNVKEDSPLLDKPTLSVSELAKKHNLPPEKILGQLKKGIAIELEHTSDEKIAKEIALDHLAEIPNYYDRLETVEEDNVDLRSGEHLWIVLYKDGTKKRVIASSLYGVRQAVTPGRGDAQSKAQLGIKRIEKVEQPGRKPKHSFGFGRPKTGRQKQKDLTLEPDAFDPEKAKIRKKIDDMKFKKELGESPLVVSHSDAIRQAIAKTQKWLEEVMDYDHDIEDLNLLGDVVGFHVTPRGDGTKIMFQDKVK